MIPYKIKKHALLTGPLLAVMSLSSASSLWAAPGVMVDDTTFAERGGTGWFSSNVAPMPTRTGGPFFNAGLMGDTNGSVFRINWNATTGGGGTLAVGEMMQLTFDIARSANLAGKLRVTVFDSGNSCLGYSFNASLGTAVKTAVFRSTRGAFSTDYAATGTAAALVGSDIAANFSTFKWTIERLDADSLKFEVFQGTGPALLSVVKNYDGIDQPADQLYASFNRVMIGADSPVAGASFQLDNVKLAIVTVGAPAAAPATPAVPAAPATPASP
jgi:hypothetical protein